MLKLKNLDYENYGLFVHFAISKIFSEFEQKSSEILKDSRNNHGTPKISLICVSEASSSDMFGIVTSDNGTVVEFSKEVTLQNKKTNIGSYCIAKRYLTYLHFYSKSIINNVMDFVLSEEDICSRHLKFFRNSEEISYEDILSDIESVSVYYGRYRIETVPDLVRYFEKCQPLLAYYIPEKNYDYIHIFDFLKGGYSRKEGVYELIEDRQYDEVLAIYQPEINGFFPRLKTRQQLNREVANLIIDAIFPLIF